MAKKMALVPPELVSEYYQINKPEIRLEDNIHNLLQQDDMPNDLRAKLLSHMVSRYQRIMQPPPPKKPFEIPPELLSALDSTPPSIEVPKDSSENLQKEPPEIENTDLLVKYLAYAVPKSRKRYISPIIERLKNINYVFNDHNELVVEGELEPRSNVIDLFSFLMRDLKQNEIPPRGFEKFFNGLVKINIPQSWIGNKRVAEQLNVSEADLFLKKDSSPRLKTPPTIVKKKTRWIPWSD